MNKLIFLILVISYSCAGYRVKTMDNPFKHYGIYSISVPMFINQSVFAHVSSDFTREIMTELQGHTGLEIRAGEHFKQTDAVLIGILESPSNLKEAKAPSSSRFVTGELEDSIGERPSFYLPSQTQVSLTLRLMLIKKPSSEEIELLSKVYPGKFTSPRVIFDEKFPLSYKFSRVIEGSQNSTNAGVVNLTKNYGLMRSAVKAMAKTSSVQFRELIINAF